MENNGPPKLLRSLAFSHSGGLFCGHSMAQVSSIWNALTTSTCVILLHFKLSHVTAHVVSFVSVSKIIVNGRMNFTTYMITAYVILLHSNFPKYFECSITLGVAKQVTTCTAPDYFPRILDSLIPGPLATSVWTQKLISNHDI